MFRKAGGKRDARAESPDFESDDEDDPVMSIGGPTASTTRDARPTKRQRPDDDPNSDEENLIYDSHKPDEELREEMISVFLSDPEKSVRIFLSSYMREHGLIWYVTFLVFRCYDCLTSFFLRCIVQGRNAT